MERLRHWLPALLWASLITSFSTDTFSKEHTSRVILPVLHWLLPYASDATLDILHIVIRKCAHVFEYFVFGVLLFRAIRTPARGWNARWAGIAVLVAAVFAASDEFHQSFVPSRGPSVWDALLDTAAAAAAQLILWLWWRRRLSANSDGPPRTS
jgi:VanZ family protein